MNACLLLRRRWMTILGLASGAGGAALALGLGDGALGWTILFACGLVAAWRVLGWYHPYDSTAPPWSRRQGSRGVTLRRGYRGFR